MVSEDRITQSRVALAKKAHLLQKNGLTVVEISKKLKKSERYTYDLLKLAKGRLAEIEQAAAPDPRPEMYVAWLEGHGFDPDDDLRPEVFEAFFNDFSGRVLSPIHFKWVADALGQENLLINCPPRHAKSTIFTVWFTIWQVTRDRNLQVLIVSQSQNFARKFTNEISFHLTYDEKLIQTFGRYKPELEGTPWRPNSGELLIEGRNRDTQSGDLSIQVRGAGQQMLGLETGLLIVDDPVSRKKVISETERENLSEWFHGDVMTRLEPDSHAIVIGQRLHVNDLYGELAAERDEDTGEQIWTHITYPAVLDWETKETLWPEKWPWENLAKVRRRVGTNIFEAMYQQNPLMDSKRLARKEWIYGDAYHPGCLDLDRSAGYGFVGRERPTVRVLSIDPSPTKNAGLIVGDVFKDTEKLFEIQLIEAVLEPMSVREMITHIDRCIALYGPDYFIFEQAAAQRWFLQDREMDRIRRQLRVIPHNTGRNKADPVLGTESLSLDFEFGRIRFPYGDSEGRRQSDLLIEEAYNYPQGLHDDLLMALWFIKYNSGRLIPVERLLADYREQMENIPQRLRGGWDWWPS